MAKDCKAFVRACHQCQLFSNVPRAAPAMPVSIISPNPFAVWVIDIMSPFPKARGELQFVTVAIDYMTKWAEAKALRTITQELGRHHICPESNHHPLRDPNNPQI